MFCRLTAALVGSLLLLSSLSSFAEDKPVLRVGVLKFGTVNWELDVVKTHGLDKKNGINIEVVPLAAKNASHVAIQGGSVDIIVTDWVWVSRQRGEGRNYTFVPYSTAAGAVMVAPDANINSIEDLEGKRLGVAGGAVDKSWLLLRAYGKRTLDKDLKDLVTPNFAAPPLLNKLALRGEIPAVLNFWHYSARLKAQGFKPLISIPSILDELEIQSPIPLIGWVFKDDWAEKNKAHVQAFVQASQDAKKILATSDDEWERLAPLIKDKEKHTRDSLRDAYRAGIANCFDDGVKQAAAKTFTVLAEEGGVDLVGSSTALADGTFWDGYSFPACVR